VSGAPAKSGTSRFLAEANITPGKHRVSSRSGFKTLTIAPGGNFKLARDFDFFEASRLTAKNPNCGEWAV
jgi:hypothetical protein